MIQVLSRLLIRHEGQSKIHRIAPAFKRRSSIIRNVERQNSVGLVTGRAGSLDQ
jgi:hypothetical protein